MFKLLSEFLRPRQQPPFGLTEEKIQKLRALRAEDGWDVYISLLDNSAKLNAEALLKSRSTYDDTLNKGIVIGLRKAGTLIDELLAKHEQHREYERRRHDNDNGRNDRSGSLRWTPGWSDTIKR